VRGESISDASLRSEQLFIQKFSYLFCRGTFITVVTTAPQLSPDM